MWLEVSEVAIRARQFSKCHNKLTVKIIIRWCILLTCLAVTEDKGCENKVVVGIYYITRTTTTNINNKSQKMHVMVLLKHY